MGNTLLADYLSPNSRSTRHVHQALHLRDTRNSLHEALNALLYLHWRLVSMTTTTTLTPPSVFLRSHRLLRQTCECRTLLTPETLHPGFHVLQHLALNRGRTLVEIGMEAVEKTE
jgi:hypothetical protein